MTPRLHYLMLGVLSMVAMSPLGVARATTSSVSITNYMFTPDSLSIHVGDKVTWTNKAIATPHTVTSDDGAWKSSGELSQGQMFSVTFNKAGTFGYHCEVHPFMTGAITVASSSPAPSATPTHSRTPTPRATATAKPAAPASPTPTRSVKPSPRASHTAHASKSAMPTPTSSRIVAAGATSSISWGVVTGIVAVAIALIGIAGFAVRRRRTVR